MVAIEGIDAEPVSAWIEANVAGVRGPLEYELIAGGRSNLTFRVTDAAGQAYVLRRPPTSHVLPTAHDMGREYRIITALRPTSVPVPRTFGLCTDESVNGRPFYVMACVEGHVLRDVATVEAVFAPAQRRAAAEDLIDVLVELHNVDVDAIGLGDLGRRDSYIERQLKRWYGQYEQSAAMQGHTVPPVEEMHAFLSARIPPQAGAGIVHGDYRLDNTMFGEDARVAAVLDWEICTLGDPMADLGLLMVYWAEPGDTALPLGVAPTACPGFPTRAEMIERYATRSGRDVTALDFYIAFGYWKLACILEGVYARYVGGARGGDRTSVDTLGDQVRILCELSRDAAARL